MQDFRNVKAWQKAYELTLDVYRLTGSFPVEEVYGLTAQVRRSVFSIATNVAEGCGRQSDADFARFVGIALGSCHEVQNQLLLARDLCYLGEPDFESLDQKQNEVRRMLVALRNRLISTSRRRPQALSSKL